jgi:hypothetical protein
VSRLRVHCFPVSLDGCNAGPNQDLENPIGVGGLAVLAWQFGTRTHHQMSGRDGGTTGIDNDFVDLVLNLQACIRNTAGTESRHRNWLDRSAGETEKATRSRLSP